MLIDLAIAVYNFHFHFRMGRLTCGCLNVKIYVKETDVTKKEFNKKGKLNAETWMKEGTL